MATPIAPIPPLLQAEIDMIKDFLVQIENRIAQAGNLVNAQVGAGRVDLQAQADEAQQRLTELSSDIHELDDDLVQLTRLISQRLGDLIHISHNLFNILSLLAWKQIFFAVYIRTVFRILFVFAISWGVASYFGWSASQHVAGWAREYATLHGRAYIDKVPHVSSASSPLISKTGYSSVMSYDSPTLTDLGVITGYETMDYSKPKFIAPPVETNITTREPQNGNKKSWWWQRPASTAICTPSESRVTLISTADIQKAKELANLKAIMSLIIDTTEQIAKQVGTSVEMSRAALKVGHQGAEIAECAKRSAEQVAKSVRILEDLIDLFSSMINQHARESAG